MDVVVLKVVDDAEQPAGDSSKEMPSDVHSTTREHERQEIAEKIRQYQTGEKGKLNSIFPGSLRHWLDHCYNLGEQLYIVSVLLNPFKPSDAKWLHFKVFGAILV